MNLEGTIVISDCWKAYSRLQDEGWQHYQVNHSIQFVDPSNPMVHTNSIEGTWRLAKLSIPCRRYVLFQFGLKDKRYYIGSESG